MTKLPFDPNHMVTPGVYVQRLVPANPRANDIEERTFRRRAGAMPAGAMPVPA
jgi:3-oxoacid CoA-transferase subunit A